MFANHPLLCCQGLEEPIPVFTKVVNDVEQWAKQRRQQLLVELRAMDQLSYAERRSQLRALQLELHPDKQENLDYLDLFDSSEDCVGGGVEIFFCLFFGGGERKRDFLRGGVETCMRISGNHFMPLATATTKTSIRRVDSLQRITGYWHFCEVVQFADLMPNIFQNNLPCSYNMPCPIFFAWKVF